MAALGNLLRSNPAEKERFVREAHAAWVGGGWAVRGDTTPGAERALMALEEATRRLAERYGWRREEGELEIRLPKEVRERLRVLPRAARGEGVFPVSPGGLSAKAVWAAAYRLLGGEQVILVPTKGTREETLLLSRRRILEGVKELLLKKEEENTEMPWGERVRILPGDRWETPGRREPRLEEAIRGLQAQVLEWDLARGEEMVRWEHEEVPFVLAWAHRDPERPLRKPRWSYSTWELVVREGARVVPPTYEEVRRKLEKPSWAAIRLLGPLVAYEVSALGFKDPEAAYQEGLLEALRIWDRLKRKGGEFNPLLFLVPELRKYLLELRAREVGVFSLSREVARKLRKYFALVGQGESPEKALKEVGLPEELVGTGQLSGDELAEEGVEPSSEVDYDTLILRSRVREVREEIGRWYGAPGLTFVDALMDGASIEGAQVVSGLSPQLAQQVVEYLRAELEGWGD